MNLKHAKSIRLKIDKVFIHLTTVVTFLSLTNLSRVVREVIYVQCKFVRDVIIRGRVLIQRRHLITNVGAEVHSYVKHKQTLRLKISFSYFY